MVKIKIPEHLIPKYTEWLESYTQSANLTDGVLTLDIPPELIKLIKTDNATPSNELLLNFETWWNTFPANDSFAHYLPSRSLRISKGDCFELWKKAAEKYSPKVLLDALTREIEVRQQDSWANGNAFRFMMNTKNYLTNEAYEGFITTDEFSSESPQLLNMSDLF